LSKKAIETYRGSCHCGRVQFLVKTDLLQIVECNCSICTKKGYLHHIVLPGYFELLSGKDDLFLYQFGTRIAEHYFCKHCGICPFCIPRSDPDKIDINVRCLDDIDITKCKVACHFDGRNWEEAILNNLSWRS